MIRKTREEIIRLFQERFPDEDIDYSNVGEYNGFHEKIYGLHCNTCGNTFGIKPATAVRKTRTMLCGECAKELKHSKERMTFEKFLERAHAMYGVKYTYFTETWKDYQTPMHVKCNTCGYEYDQTPTSHINNGCGCRKCADKANSERMSMTFEEMLAKFREKHGNKYDYSKVKYLNRYTEIEIICPIHGSFYQMPDVHSSGSGCPKCGLVNSGLSRRTPESEVLQKFHEVHKDLYDYSEVVYQTMTTPVSIICKEHGAFLQTPYNHIKGHGCPTCAYISNGLQHRLSFEEFVEKARQTHTIQYEYVRESYEKRSAPVSIICPKHGLFQQYAANHLSGYDCPKCFCNTSKAEQEITAFIENELHLTVENNIRITHNGKQIEFDIYIPELRIAFEHDGLYWHSEVKIPDSNYHENKRKIAEENGITLYHIFEDEWRERTEIVKSRIRSITGKTSSKIYARKCSVAVLEDENRRAKDFLDATHIQGYAKSDVQCFLKYENKDVACMTFSRNRYGVGSSDMDAGVWELSRFSTIKNTAIIGAASKMLKAFETRYKPTKIISYADKRWSSGKMYETIGFEREAETQPSYSYVVEDKRYHRLAFTKHVLVDKYNCEPDVSEHEFCLTQGWYRIYDCGKIRFVKNCIN